MANNLLTDLITNTDTTLNLELQQDTVNNLTAIFDKVDTINSNANQNLAFMNQFYNPINSIVNTKLTSTAEPSYINADLEKANGFQKLANELTTIPKSENRMTNLAKWELTPEVYSRFVAGDFGFDYTKSNQDNEDLYAKN